jgi:hypothetical protein
LQDYNFSFKPFGQKEENAFKAKLLRLLISAIKIKIELNEEYPFATESLSQYEFSYDKDKKDYYNSVINELNTKLKAYTMELSDKIKTNKNNDSTAVDGKMRGYVLTDDLIQQLDFLDNLAYSLNYNTNDYLEEMVSEECHFLFKDFYINDKQVSHYYLCLNGVGSDGFYIVKNNKIEKINYKSVVEINFENDNLYIMFDPEEIFRIDFKSVNDYEHDMGHKYILLLQLFLYQNMYANSNNCRLRTIVEPIIFKTDQYKDLNKSIKDLKRHTQGQFPTGVSIINKIIYILIMRARDISDLQIYSIFSRSHGLIE